MFFVLSSQNQLLAKGLLFVEEKIKLCEGKYKARSYSGLCDSASDVRTAEMLLSKSGGLQVSESPRPFLLQLGGSTSLGAGHSWWCVSDLYFEKSGGIGVVFSETSLRVLAGCVLVVSCEGISYTTDPVMPFSRV